ncbi:DNA-binding CsgD family transcriptional regulator [Saccharopolyspora lacisalsi]|uniref:DNA-binding CsgD family transcriptional regulator n=1 Tax=Halosaccharopolyspora lacisalsi TaxID=1000566 RepID=A0A839DZN4_9PSEU|nr:LuxR C-terminal-related transcriptional regulator [Halosaccharopolyspora lacisalsi]MBA8827402.1 DNA-binding CsgD family transcriptional regulator [Halosaccharopolyspora lacisalsi]
MNHPTVAPPVAAAARLRSAIAADPSAAVVTGIQGAGGYGKTALLDELARIYRHAGVPVREESAADPTDPAGAAVLVDDAHLLDEPMLRKLGELALSRRARLIVAYRPWPRSAALDELVGVLGRSSPPVLLGPLERDEVAEQLGDTEPSSLLEWLCSATGAVPRLVTRMISAGDPARYDRTRPPRAVLDQFHHDLERLDERARQCLTALAVGANPHPTLLASLLDIDYAAAEEAMAAVRAGGLLDSDDTVLPVVREAVLALMPRERRLSVLRRLVGIRLDRGGPVLALVRPLLEAQPEPLPDETLAAAFARAGDEALSDSPELAVRLFDAAVSAGAEGTSVTARRAQGSAMAGDLDEALRAADRVIVDESAADRALGIRVAATVLAHRGLLARSAELCRWSVDNVRWSGDSAFAVVGLASTGRVEEAGGLLRSHADAGPPTSLSGAATQLAEGVYESVTGSASTALSTLVRAATLAEPSGSTVLMPDTPAAVASTVALHCGEFDVAESVVDRAVETGAGGPLQRVRHQLLAAWVPLLRGDTVTARAKLDVAIEGASALGARDRLTAIAIEAGIANRDNDMTTLGELRGRARQAVAEHPIDLFTLLPLGELVMATARLREQEWLMPYLREARTLLTGSGVPPLWSALLHWKCLQAAVVLEQHDQVREHATALEGMAGHNTLSAALYDAACMWLRLLAGDVDQDEAERTARALHAAGMAWDGARLAGQAAIRTTDRRVMMALLECARALQGKMPRPRKLPDTASVASAPQGGDLLSGREREVAELVLAGLTYKQVGKRLFISAKTVEHHVGRVKQRLGCSSREELLTQLRTLLD